MVGVAAATVRPGASAAGPGVSTFKQTKSFYEGKRRRIRYKEVAQVHWRRGAGQIPLCLCVVAPTPYRQRQSSKLYYRQPAYLLTTDLKPSASPLLPIHFDRWQIEVNHRDEKDTLGVGQAQLWNIHAVPKQLALVVAAYSALLLAALKAFGTERTQTYQALPRWRRQAHRPSCLDLVTLLRQEMVGHPENPQSPAFQLTDRALTHAADARKCRNSRRRAQLCDSRLSLPMFLICRNAELRAAPAPWVLPWLALSPSLVGAETEKPTVKNSLTVTTSPLCPVVHHALFSTTPPPLRPSRNW